MGNNDENINGNNLNLVKSDLLAAVLKYQLNFLRNKLSNFFNNLDDSLFNLAEKSHSNKEQSHYFDSLRLVRSHRSLIKQNFTDRITNHYQSYQQGLKTFVDEELSVDQPLSSMALIESSELDKKLVMDDLVKKSESAYLEQIYCLNKRMDVLVADQNNATYACPLMPFSLVKLFSQSIDSIEFDSKITVIIYKLFERNVMAQLNSLYTQINKFLIENNILPNIKYDIKKKELAKEKQENKFSQDKKNTKQFNERAATKQQSTYGNFGNYGNQENQPYPSKHNQNSDSDLSKQQSLDKNFQLILEMLRLGHQSMQRSYSDNADEAVNLPYLSLGIMIDALSILQNNLFRNKQINEPLSKSPTEIKDDLIMQLHQVDASIDENRVKQRDIDIIDLVGLLFQFIVDDRNLPNEMQLILVKLQIPYLKIALQDRNLFADKTHEARVLLDSMAVACVGWSEEYDWNNKFRSKIEEITLHILQCENYNTQFFTILQLNFDSFMKHLTKKSDIAQRRAKETTTGEEKIIKAKKDSAQLLVEKMSNHTMPKLVRDILLGEWSSVLVLMFLRHSSTDEVFLEKVAFIEQLIEFSQLEKNKSMTVFQIQQLLDVYKSGLNLVAYNPSEINEKCAQLSQCLTELHALAHTESAQNDHLKILKADNLFNLDDMRNKKHGMADFIEEVIEPMPKLDPKHQHIEAKYYDVVESLSEGHWLEFSRFPQARLRAKLSWVSTITDDYAFVNSRGMKVLTCTKSDLAYRFKMRKVRVLEQKAIFDRALSTIALRLKVANFSKK